MLIRNGLHLVKFKRLPVKMHPNDRFGSLRDLFLDLFRVDLPGIRRAIHKHRCCPGISNPPCGGDIRIGRNDHFIACSNPHRHHGTVKSRCSIVHPRRIRNLAKCRKLLVKPVCKLSAGKCRLPTHLLNCF